MKKVLLLALVANICFFSQPAHATTGQSVKGEKNAEYWQKMADGMTQSLIKNFWGASFNGYELSLIHI